MHGNVNVQHWQKDTSLQPDFTQAQSLSWSGSLAPLFLFEAVPEHQSSYVLLLASSWQLPFIHGYYILY